MTNSIESPYTLITDTSGHPIDSGYIFIGNAGQNPEVSPVAVYWDASMTIPAAQPIRTVNGYPSRSGSPSQVYVEGDYSITIRDSNLELVFTSLRPSRRIDSIILPDQVFTTKALAAAANPSTSVNISITDTDGGIFHPVSGSIAEFSDNGGDYAGTQFIPLGGDGSLAWIRSGYKASILPQWFGAKMDGLTDDTSSLQAAIDYAATLPGRTCVSLSGLECRTTDEIFLYTNVVLKDGNILFDPSANDKFAVNIGWQDGRALVRVAGVVNVEVEVQSGNVRTGLAAFNFGHGARACFIHASRAKMETGAAASNKGHFGFSFYGIRDDLVIASGGVNGAYQNTISQCAVYAADIAYRLDTDGFGEVGFKAQMNANSIKQCSAYACTTSALMVGEGAQENDIDVRADTFISSIGLGTTVTVCEVRGSFNNIVCQEEIGSRGDTQYTVAFNGSNPRYNTVKYSTQQVVTSDVFFNESGSSVGKNVATNICRPINVNGNDVFCISGYNAVLASATDSVDEIIFDNKCILIKAVARNELTPASFSRLYFAKNGTIDTVQRLTWDNTDAVGTIKTLNTDPTTAGTIDSRFIYDAGDRVRVRIDQDSSGGQTLGWTLYFKSLHRS